MTLPAKRKRGAAWSMVGAFGSFLAAAALAAGVVGNYVQDGTQPHLDVAVFFFVMLLGGAFCFLADYARAREESKA